jgi:hypothetical protein
MPYQNPEKSKNFLCFLRYAGKEGMHEKRTKLVPAYSGAGNSAW